MIGRSGALRRGRGLAALVVSAVLCLGLASCAQRTSARGAFGDEKLTNQDYPGLVEVDENWTDGEKGGLWAFATRASVLRGFEAASRAELEAGFKQVTAVAVAEGWVADPPSGLEFTFTAEKEFPAGQGLLRILI